MPRKGENIYRRRDNRWEGRYKVGFDESGKSRYRSIYGKSYQEVKIKLIALRSAPKEAVSSGRLTVKELFEEWLSAVKLRVKESTYAKRKNSLRSSRPAIGRNILIWPTKSCQTEKN